VSVVVATFLTASTNRGDPTIPPLLPCSLAATSPRSRARHCREEDRNPSRGNYQFVIDRTLGAISTSLSRSGKGGRVRIALDWPPASTNFIADIAESSCAVGGLPRCFDWRYETSSNARRCTNFIFWAVELVAMHRRGADSTNTGELCHRGCTSPPRRVRDWG
jgi:hypothetical protein